MIKRSLKFLIVDDEALIRATFVDYLEDAGHEAVEAASGEEALKLLAQLEPNDKPFDVIFCDLRMPGMGGLQLIERVRNSYPDLPIVAVSGVGVIETALEAVRKGAWDFISKPIYELALLLHVAETVCERAELRRQNEKYRRELENLVLDRTDSLRRSRAEVENAELREKEQRLLLDAFFKAAPCGMALCVDHRLVLANERMSEILAVETAMGVHVSDIFVNTAVWRQAKNTLCQQFHSNDVGHCLTRWLKKDGSEISVELRAVPIQLASGSSGYAIAAIESLPSPLSKQASMSTTSPKEILQEENSSKSKGILLVDNDPEQAFFARVTLERVGYRVWAAESVESAADLLEKNVSGIGIVLLMENVPMYDMLIQLLELSYPHKVVILGASSNAAVPANITALLEMPVDVLQLPAQIERILNR